MALSKKYRDDLEFRVWCLVATARKGKKAPQWKVIEEIEDLLDELENKGRFDFVNHIDNILEKGRKSSLPSYSDLEIDVERIIEDIIDSGPFRIPKKTQSSEKAKPKPTPKAKPAGGKQLNLFDDEL